MQARHAIAGDKYAMFYVSPMSLSPDMKELAIQGNDGGRMSGALWSGARPDLRSKREVLAVSLDAFLAFAAHHKTKKFAHLGVEILPVGRVAIGLDLIREGAFAAAQILNRVLVEGSVLADAHLEYLELLRKIASDWRRDVGDPVPVLHEVRV